MIKTTVREGIILIPDFSGFTEFVYNTKMYTGEFIVKQLLSELITANSKSFHISEIEGDAILFYKYMKRPSYRQTVDVLLRMLEAFNKRIDELNLQLNMKIEMSLKLIVHHGKFSKYQIKNFRKLYGSTIIEAHRLLKNEHAEHPSYILFSNAFLTAVQKEDYNFSENIKYIPEIGRIHHMDKFRINETAIL